MRLTRLLTGISPLMGEKCSQGRLLPLSLIKQYSINRTKDIGADSESDRSCRTKEAGSDGEGAEGIEDCLPCVSCRVTNTNSANDADIRIHGWRKYVIQYKENQTADDVIRTSLFGTFDNIRRKRQTDGHACNAGPHGSR